MEYIKTSVDNATKYIDKKIAIVGWVKSYRKQSKLQFIDLRQADVYIQCVAFKQPDFKGVAAGACVRISGVVTKLPEGKTAPGGIELSIELCELIGPVTQEVVQVRDDAGIDTKRANIHFTVRSPEYITTLQQVSQIRTSTIMVMNEMGVAHVEVPALTPTACEGGAELFATDFFGTPAYLTQSSQLYLEPLVPALGPVYCLAKSWRAEPSRTRRHLAEFEHMEMEGMFETLDELTSFIEIMISKIASMAYLSHGIAKTAAQWKLPFIRMTYKEAITFCEDHQIYKDDGSKYILGEDIPESAERKILAIMDKPMFITRFPCKLKAFYMLPCADDPEYAEACDLLLPGVGEVVGGSLRIHDHDQLVTAAKAFNTDLSVFPWYEDIRKCGSFPHGGFGLGMERLFTTLLELDHIEKVVAFPISRAMPPF